MNNEIFRKERRRFFIGNMFRGAIWLFLILSFFIFLEVMEFDYYVLLNPFYNHPFLLILIFTFSEVFFGIIPPELFMIWARGYGDISQYVEIVVILASISYMAGILGYFTGRYLGGTKFFRRLEEKRLNNVIPLIRKYGFSLVIIAALTPVPFSATCMVTGSVRYSFRKFLLFAGFRFIRYAVYSYFVWHATI
ncbi:MAG TPA: hypothetical protein ENK25_05750 [Bacteroidetes bacterium]|nr:hypothetical protein [Bacteroidota bacterium]